MCPVPSTCTQVLDQAAPASLADFARLDVHAYSKEDWERSRVGARPFLAALQAASGGDEQFFTEHAFLDLYRLCRANATAIGLDDGSGLPEAEGVCVGAFAGSAVCTLHAQLNHSCTPNALVHPRVRIPQ